MNENSRIEDLLTEIRDLQAETRDVLKAQGQMLKTRSDMALGNIPVSRSSSLIFVVLGLIFVLGVIYFLTVR